MRKKGTIQRLVLSVFQLFPWRAIPTKERLPELQHKKARSWVLLILLEQLRPEIGQKGLSYLPVR
jgi:hypothetical protein